MVDVRTRIDARPVACDVRRLTTELTLAPLTRGRGMSGWRAHFAAATAVGGVARRVHAGRTTVGLAATGQRAASAFANLARATGFGARAAVLGIRALIDALARTIDIAAVAIERALPTAAERNAVRC